jgi:hypothetical protein
MKTCERERALITGGKGFIGQHLAQHLNGLGYEGLKGEVVEIGTGGPTEVIFLAEMIIYFNFNRLLN